MTGRIRSAAPVVVLAFAVLAAAYLGGTTPDGPPLDPRSAAPAGTRALVDTLAGLGADVRVAAGPRGDDTAALLLTDTLEDARRGDVEAWVRDGGVLVVTDPLSPLSPEPTGIVGDDGGFVVRPLRPGCDLDALRLVGEIHPPASSAVLATPAGATGCFMGPTGDWMVVEAREEGTLVSLGGPDVFTNAALREGDHALLAVSLLAPDPARARVTVVRPPRPGEGDATLVDLIPDSVRLALLQLGIALLLLMAWRARRLGRPVAETQPVAIPASELVVASGNLLADAGASGRAAGLLREDLRRRLAERCGLSPSVPADRLADVLVARHGVAREDVARVFDGGARERDDDLVALAQAVERLHAQVLQPTATGGPP